ncbi:MAG: hypothetical protein ACYC5N_11315 [Endomicrobiales bacterium]
MRKYVLLLSVFVLMFALVTASQAAVTFKIGPSFNLFGDARVSGLGTGFNMMFDLDKLSAGFKTEQQNLTVTDAQNSANNFLVSNQVSLLVLDKEIAAVANDLPVTIGLELGSLQMTGLAGTVAAPAGISQALPVVGINGGIKYNSAGKGITTSLFLNLGYRFVDIRDVAVPAAFTAGGANFKDLNAVRIEAGVSLGF